MRSNEIIRQQCDATIRIAESIAHTIEQDKECRKLITQEYISHINRLAAERDSLIREVEKLTEMLSYKAEHHLQQHQINQQHQHKMTAMKIVLYIILFLISPFIMMALLNTSAHLMQWVSKQLDKLKANKAGKVFAKIVGIVASVIGLLIIAFLYFVGY